MIDPTAKTQLDNPPTWSDANIADAGFARRCVTYLREQGLEPQAIVLALQTELDLAATYALTLVDSRPVLAQPSTPGPSSQQVMSTCCAGSTVSPRRGPFTATPLAPNVQLITT